MLINQESKTFLSDRTMGAGFKQIVKIKKVKFNIRTDWQCISELIFIPPCLSQKGKNNSQR